MTLPPIPLNFLIYEENFLFFFISALTQTYRRVYYSWADLTWPVGLKWQSIFRGRKKGSYTRTNPNHDEDGAVVEVGELCAQQDEQPEGGEGGEEGGHHPCQTHPRLKQ